MHCAVCKHYFYIWNVCKTPAKNSQNSYPYLLPTFIVKSSHKLILDFMLLIHHTCGIKAVVVRM